MVRRWSFGVTLWEITTFGRWCTHSYTPHTYVDAALLALLWLLLTIIKCSHVCCIQGAIHTPPLGTGLSWGTYWGGRSWRSQRTAQRNGTNYIHVHVAVNWVQLSLARQTFDCARLVQSSVWCLRLGSPVPCFAVHELYWSLHTCDIVVHCMCIYHSYLSMLRNACKYLRTYVYTVWLYSM